MNIFAHFLLNYVLVSAIYGNPNNYLWLIIIFSVFIDLDHIPYILKVKTSLIKKKFGSESRTRFHELYGITFFSLIFSILIFFFDTKSIQIAALCLMLHYAADLLVGKSRPFYPYIKKEIFLGILPEKYRIKFEFIFTILMVVIIWIFLLN